MNFREFKNSSGKFRLAKDDEVKTILGATYEDLEYLEPMITAAEYLDDIDMYVDERPIAIVEEDNSSGPWVYFGEAKIPSVDTKLRTHKEFGFVGKLPGMKKKITK